MINRSLTLDILRCPSWVKSQIGTIIGITSMSFITLWLEDKGSSTKDILQALSLLYFVILLPLMFKRSVGITFSLLSLSSFGLMLSPVIELTIGVSVFGFSLCLFVATIQSARDLFYVDLMNDYSHIGEKHSIDIPNVIAATMLVGVVVTSVSTPILGALSSTDSSLYFYLLGFLGVGMALGLMGRKDIQGASIKTKAVMAKLPNSVHWLCSISTLVNIVSFYTRFFVLPISLLQMAKMHGFENSVLLLAGSLIGVMSIVGFLFKGTANAETCRRDMYISIGFVLVACALIGIVSMLSHIDLILGTGVFAIGYVMLEVCSKVWTINFIALLRQQGELTGSMHEGFIAFARYKAAGGFLGFLMAYLLYGLLGVAELSLFLVFAVVTIVFIIATQSKDVVKKAAN